MKIKNLFLSLALLAAFGTTELLSQTVAPSTSTTTKKKRSYTKKTQDVQAIQNGQPATITATDATKPKRKYTKKSDVANTANSTSATTEVAKPKRSYTKKTTAATSAPANTATPTAVPEAAKPAKPVKQAKAAKPAVKKSSGYQQTATGETYNGHQVMVGPRGGKYYINKNGNKTYIK